LCRAIFLVFIHECDDTRVSSLSSCLCGYLTVAIFELIKVSPVTIYFASANLHHLLTAYCRVVLTMFLSVVLAVATVLSLHIASLQGFSICPIPHAGSVVRIQPLLRETRFRSQKKLAVSRDSSSHSLFALAKREDREMVATTFPIEVFKYAEARERTMNHLWPDPEETLLLDELATAVEGSSIGAGIVPIHLNSARSAPMEARIAPTTIFKRNFADDLLHEISLPAPGQILVGSAGTGKSMFQFTLLRHLLTNPQGTILWLNVR
jgi:hypothetical protein